jgi:hypothetical protein
MSPVGARSETATTSAPPTHRTSDDSVASHCGRDLVASLKKVVGATRPASSLALSGKQRADFVTIDSVSLWEVVHPRIREEAAESALMSFDLEWHLKDNPKVDRPALALIGVGTGSVYCLQLSCLQLGPSWFPRELSSLLEDPAYFLVGSDIAMDAGLASQSLDPDRMIDTRAALKYLKNMRVLDDNPFVENNARIGLGHQALAAWNTVHAFNKCGGKAELEKALGKGCVPKSFLSDPYRDPKRMYRWGGRFELEDRQMVYLHVDAQAPIALLQFGAASLINANPTVFDGVPLKEVFRQLFHRVIGVYFERCAYLVTSIPDFLKDTELGWRLTDRLPRPDGYHDSPGGRDARTSDADELEFVLDPQERDELLVGPEAVDRSRPSKRETFSTANELRETGPRVSEASSSMERTRGSRSESQPRRSQRLDRLRAFSLMPTRVGRIGNLAELSKELLDRMGEKKVSSRFSHMPGFANGFCYRCGAHGHLVDACPVKPEKTCDYCRRPGHLVRACPVLHHVCAFCALRGHETGRGCPEYDNLEAYREHFEAFADQGLRTRERHKTVELGLWWFDPRWSAVRHRPTYAELLQVPVHEACARVRFEGFARRVELEAGSSARKSDTVKLTRAEYEALLRQARSTPIHAGAEPESLRFTPSPVRKRPLFQEEGPGVPSTSGEQAKRPRSNLERDLFGTESSDSGTADRLRSVVSVPRPRSRNRRRRRGNPAKQKSGAGNSNLI